MTRVFVGIRPDGKAREALAESAARFRPFAKGRYVDPALYHVTLAFLGEVDATGIASAAGAMALAAKGMPRFSVTLGACGRFPQILWRGVTEDGSLSLLAQRLRHTLASEGIAFDPKPFRAHITLARDASVPPEALAVALPDASFEVCSIVLFESERKEGRLAYTPRAEAWLHA